MDSMGACYATGRGVEKNLQEARKWFERALKAGYHQAHTNLSLLDDLEANEPYSSGLPEGKLNTKSNPGLIRQNRPSACGQKAG
jgi:TPR repeat protein